MVSGSSGVTLAALDDADLIERAKSEPEAFGVLYERYVDVVFAFAFARLRDRTQAEDITSQTFLQALRALPRYQQRGAPIRSWLFRIAANLIADLHRAPAPIQPLHVRQHGQTLAAAGRADPEGKVGGDTALFDPPDPRAEAAIAAWENAEDFLRLIADLTPEQRTVLQLRFAEGLSFGDIAARMARSEGAVKMLMLRGLQHLRRRMDREAADD